MSGVSARMSRECHKETSSVEFKLTAVDLATLQKKMLTTTATTQMRGCHKMRKDDRRRDGGRAGWRVCMTVVM